MLHCATAANTSIKQLTNPRQSVLPVNVAAKCIIGLLFFLVFYFYLLYRFLPYRAHRCTAKPSLQPSSVPPPAPRPCCTTSVGAFCCPTLFLCSPLYTLLTLNSCGTLGFSLKSSSSSAFCRPAWFLSSLKCVSTRCGSTLFASKA